MRRFLRELSLFPAVAHVSIGALGAAGRATFRGVDQLGLLANHPAWTWIHFLCAAAVVASLCARRYEEYVLMLSGWFMIMWAILDACWRAVMPVPLSGPVVCAVIGFLAVFLSRKWGIPDRR